MDLTTPASVSFGIIGGLTAANLNLSRPVSAGMAGLCGLLHGYVNGATLSSENPLLLSSGITSAVVSGVLLCTAATVSLKKQWQNIAIRVAGSWLAAVGLLMCGWLVRG